MHEINAQINYLYLNCYLVHKYEKIRYVFKCNR